MNEEPKSIWKKSFTGWMALVLWLAVASVAVILGSYIAALAGFSYPMCNWVENAGIIAAVCFGACLVLIYVVWPLLRWLFWKHWRWTLFGLACFATLVALFYAEEDWRGWHAWNKFKHEWEAKGEHFDFASMVPPPVPDDQNFALTPIVASSYEFILDKKGHQIQPPNTNVVNRLGMSIYSDDHLVKWPDNVSGYWLKGTRTDLKAWQQYYRALGAKTNDFPVAPQPQSPAADVLLALSKYDPSVEELRQASRLPYSRFPLNYDADRPFDVLVSHLSTLKRCSQVLQLRAIAELQNDQSEKALDDMKLLLRLTDSVHTEPFLISHLVRIAMVQMTLQPVWEGLPEHIWSDAQLGRLDHELANLDFLADYKLSMRGERACAISSLEYIRHTHDVADIQETDGRHHPFNLNFLMPSAFFYQNELTIARMHQQRTLPMVDVQNRIVSPQTVSRNDMAATNELSRFSPYYIFARLLFPQITPAARKFACAQSSVDLARVAIALERYRLAHGEFPESLNALTPQFIAKIPHDIIGGQPLHYRRTRNPSSQSTAAASGQFVLYSVGWNETDDGGEVGFKKDGSVDINQGDWVWRYPPK